MNVEHRRPLVAFLAVVAFAVMIVTLSPPPGSVHVLLTRVPSYVADLSPDTLLGPALNAIPEVVPGLAPDRPTLAGGPARSDVTPRPLGPSSSDSASGGRTAVNAVTSVVTAVRTGRSVLAKTTNRSPRGGGVAPGAGKATRPGQPDAGAATGPAQGRPAVASRPVTQRPLTTVPSTSAAAAAAAAARGAAAGVTGVVGGVLTTLVPESGPASAGPRGIAHGWFGRLPGEKHGAGLGDRHGRGRDGAPGHARVQTQVWRHRTSAPAAPHRDALVPRREVQSSRGHAATLAPRVFRGQAGPGQGLRGPKRGGHAAATASTRPQDGGHEFHGFHQSRQGGGQAHQGGQKHQGGTHHGRGHGNH